MFDTLFDDTISLITRWQPSKPYEKENQYRDELMDKLRNAFNQQSSFNFGFQNRMKITSESGRHLCDIAINEKRLGIELKKDLKHLTEIDRAESQIRRFRNYYDDLIVVLVGKTNKNALEEFRHRLISMLDSDGFNIGIGAQKRIKLIDKGSK